MIDIAMVFRATTPPFSENMSPTMPFSFAADARDVDMP